jgi:hypothetical protein
MIGLGNAFRLPGLQKYLGEKLQLDVKKVTKMLRLTGETVVTAPSFSENILSYGVAYGLALQGLGHTRILTNLLPGEIRTERLVKAKKPWAVAAAAVLLLGMSAMSASAYWAYYRPWGQDPAAQGAKEDTSPVTQAMVKANDINARVKSQNDAFVKIKTDATKEVQDTESLVAGDKEQVNWIALFKFIADAIPTPDGSNLPESAKAKYWKHKADKDDGHPNLSLAMTGEQAWMEYQKQLGAANKGGGGTDDPLGRGIDDRVQFNIEMINTRYCGDLPAYWDKVTGELRKENLNLYVRPLEHIQKPPIGKGWVVEVHGYTFNYQRALFVRDTLMENIVRFGIPPATTAAAPGSTPPADAPADKAPDTDPVRGHISHVVLYKSPYTKTNDASSFNVIKNSVLPELLGGNSFAFGPGGPGEPGKGPGGFPGPGGANVGTQGPGAGGPGAPGGTDSGATTPAPNLRDSWTPLGSIGAGNVAFGPGGPGSTGTQGSPYGPRGPGDSRPGGKFKPGMPGPGERLPGFPGPGGTLPPDTTVPPGGSKTVLHDRTEFVILFIWQEPTPSDKLRGTVEETNDTPK